MGFDGDAASFGELQRVAEQIDQNLADARRVALGLQCTHVFGDFQLQIEAALRRAVLERLGTAADQVG
ncbi:hypothetical protein D3C80_2170710 [compost metagenome]